MVDRRAWIAAVLAFLQPGLGHAYLREWLRAVAWFGLWVGTIALAVPSTGAFAEVLFRPVRTAGDLPTAAALALTAVSVFCILDAYWLASRTASPEPESPTCPDCGREVDPSLSFCHWCTARLEE